jgi:two-component system CheB/CheR fusion protein
MQERKNYIVGIGASAGGLDAVQKFFTHIPAETNIAFIVVQHLSSDFKSLMPELLAKHTDMKIFTVEDNMSIQPNCLYLNPQKKI